MSGGSRELMFSEFIVKGAAADTQTLGCPLLIPTACIQDFMEVLSLYFHKGSL